MAKVVTTLKRASAISTALILIGLGALTFSGQWWPWIVLVIGIPISIRQYLLGRVNEMFISLLVFGGVFITSQYDISWKILLPVIFFTAAIYILGKEFFYNAVPSYEEEEESHNIELEIEAEKKKKKKKPHD